MRSLGRSSAFRGGCSLIFSRGETARSRSTSGAGKSTVISTGISAMAAIVQQPTRQAPTSPDLPRIYLSPRWLTGGIKVGSYIDPAPRDDGWSSVGLAGAVLPGRPRPGNRALPGAAPLPTVVPGGRGWGGQDGGGQGSLRSPGTAAASPAVLRRAGYPSGGLRMELHPADAAHPAAGGPG